MKLVSIFKKSIIVFLASVSLTACGQTPEKKEKNNTHKEVTQSKQKTMENKMKIEIWSDVMCPFCYIGKRKFDTALAQFEHKENIEVIWKSYQLDPSLKTQPNMNVEQMMVEKGFDPQQAKAMNNQAAQMAKQVGLVYNPHRPQCM